MKKVAVYARVSTSDQNVTTQVLPLREYCQRLGYEVIGEYADSGFSGKDDRRPAFERLLADMRAGKFDGVVCYKLDRVGRSVKHLLQLFEEFERRKIGFVSLSQNIDSTTPEGRMFLQMLMILAQYERELIVSRTLSGLERARKQGKTLGRPPGIKDSRPRTRSGYYLRYARKKSTPDVTSVL